MSPQSLRLLLAPLHTGSRLCANFDAAPVLRHRHCQRLPRLWWRRRRCPCRSGQGLSVLPILTSITPAAPLGASRRQLQEKKQGRRSLPRLPRRQWLLRLPRQPRKWQLWQSSRVRKSEEEEGQRQRRKAKPPPKPLRQRPSPRRSLRPRPRPRRNLGPRPTAKPRPKRVQSRAAPRQWAFQQFRVCNQVVVSRVSVVRPCRRAGCCRLRSIS
mmetsp:Transcript_78710/g.218666  ORF Transcript_78710/g.218666 Transcript_78710/m.218666 type:complete len:213 (-) Transcript_78710:44-682(-)